MKIELKQLQASFGTTFVYITTINPRRWCCPITSA